MEFVERKILIEITDYGQPNKISFINFNENHE